MKSRLRIPVAAAILLVLGLAWIGTSAVQAHAMLIHSVPDANASLDVTPEKIDLYFSESIDPNFSKLHVLDINGQRVESGNSAVDPNDPTHISISINHLSDSVYTVSWNVISATDGHQTTGSFPFGIGKINPNALSGISTPTTGNQIPLSDVVSKAFLYVSAAALMGVILFTFLVWNPTLRNGRILQVIVVKYAVLTQKMSLSALVVFAISDVLNLFAQAGQVTGSLIAWPWQPTFLTMLMDTRVGVIGIGRLALVFILSGLLLPRQNKWNRFAALGVSLLFLLTFSLESHAAAGMTPVIPVIADWVHMIAVSVWIGGLFSFLGSMQLIRKLDPEARTRLTATLIPHFSNLALTSVGILTLTGIYSALMHIGTVQAMISTSYGQAFILKGIIGFGMVGLGAYNFLVTTPKMRQAAALPGGSPELVTHFNQRLVVEVVLGLLILVWVSVFTSLSPAKIPVSPAFTRMTKVDDLTVTLTIDPNKPGTNTFVALVKSGSTLVNNAKSVSLEFTSLSGMVPASKAAMANNNDGSYTLTGGYLGMADQWDVKVVVVRQGKYDAYADYKVKNSQTPTQPIPRRTIASVLIVLSGFGYAFAFRMIDWNIKRWITLGVIPAIAMGAAGIVAGIL